MTDLREAYLVTGVRTPIGRYGGALATVRPDDLAARAIRTGDAELVIAGGVESMSRAPFVMGKAESAFARQAEIFDTTLGWRFVNPRLNERYGTDTMTETAENVAVEYDVSRADQDLFALQSQERAAKAAANGRFAEEIA